jgi:hypothetical protein
MGLARSVEASGARSHPSSASFGSDTSGRTSGKSASCRSPAGCRGLAGLGAKLKGPPSEDGSRPRVEARSATSPGWATAGAKPGSAAGLPAPSAGNAKAARPAPAEKAADGRRWTAPTGLEPRIEAAAGAGAWESEDAKPPGVPTAAKEIGRAHV